MATRQPAVFFVTLVCLTVKLVGNETRLLIRSPFPSWLSNFSSLSFLHLPHYLIASHTCLAVLQFEGREGKRKKKKKERGSTYLRTKKTNQIQDKSLMLAVMTEDLAVKSKAK